MPKMSTAALRANKSTVGPFRGAMVKASASTIRAIGRTDETASLNFVPTALSNGNTSQHIKYLYAIITFPRGSGQRRAGKMFVRECLRAVKSPERQESLNSDQIS